MSDPDLMLEIFDDIYGDLGGSFVPEADEDTVTLNKNGCPAWEPMTAGDLALAWIHKELKLRKDAEEKQSPKTSKSSSFGGARKCPI